MAETVVSMARSMLGGAISKAASAAAAEMSLIMGVQKDIWFIKDELKTMQAFLAAAEATKNKDMLLKVWAEQIRDMSYNIEDCLNEFMVHVGSQSLTRQLLKLKDRHRIAVQIRNLKSRVEEVSNRNTRYNLIRTEASSTVHDEVASYVEDLRNHSASNIDESDLVGFVKPKEELIKMMDVRNGEVGLVKKICVVGMGGLGKTTLARKVYENKEHIANYFSCCAWITVSQSFFKMEILKDMIKQLLGNESLQSHLKKLQGKTIQVQDLANYLIEGLDGKRYFIVLDDLWTIDQWKWIHTIAFPSNNIKGSRILVTTRHLGLAREITLEPLIYELQPLQLVDAQNLLLRKSRRTHEDMENVKNMETIKKIVKRCGYLPLAIITIGGMLATKLVNEWESIYELIPYELENNPSLEAIRRIVTLSYSQLPSHLKSCFLYLSIFPEDFEIQRRRLVERWIAEGFVRARGGVSIEDVGIGYFNELINRSMIQPSKVNIEGIVKSCRVHDIVRDVMVSIARDESFVFLAGDSSVSAGISDENFRHIAYHSSKCREIGMDSWSHVRSLTMFGERPVGASHLLCSPNLRMLRVLDAENIQFQPTQKDINKIGLLRHLKYLNVGCNDRYSFIYKLPRFIGKLQDLETLNIERSHITKLPSEITKLKSLRTLSCKKSSGYCFDAYEPIRCFAYSMCWPFMFLCKHDYRELFTAELHMACSTCGSASRGVRVPRGIGKLKELQILDVVDIKRTSSKAVAELGELTQLKKLGVLTLGASQQKLKIFCASIEKLTSLLSLDMVGIRWFNDKQTLEWMNSMISSPPRLPRSLKLTGCFGEIPEWVGSLMYLVKIHLMNSKLKEGGKTMEILGALPNLMLLVLLFDSYLGEKLVFGGEAIFPNLKKLRIYYMSKLKEVRFEEGTSPHMETIEIGCCTLETGIIGIKHLSKLREISLGYDARVAKLGVLQREVDAHTNHPVMRLMHDFSQHDLPGDVDQGSNDVQVLGLAADQEEPSLLPQPAAAAAAESSNVPVTTTSNCNGGDDDLLYTYNSC